MKRSSLNLKKEINKKASKDKRLESGIYILARDAFNKAKQKLLNTFLEHPVTKELKGGASASSSNGLTSGNLFGFIGFESNADPVNQLEKSLRSLDINIFRRRSVQSQISWSFKINLPTMEEFYSMTPMPWAQGMSWLREMEGKGIPNLAQYMNVESEHSRSTAGIETSKGGSSYLKIAYIKPMVEQFKEDVNKIQTRIISIK